MAAKALVVGQLTVGNNIEQCAMVCQVSTVTLRSTVSIWLSVYLIIAKVLVVLVVISIVVLALILIVIAAIYKEGSIHFLTRVFLFLYNN